MKIGKVKVTLHFRNGGAMTFKCVEFQITRSKDGGYSSATTTNLKGHSTSFSIGEVIGVQVKNVLF
jgi:hypothetical protein